MEEPTIANGFAGIAGSTGASTLGYSWYSGFNLLIEIVDFFQQYQECNIYVFWGLDMVYHNEIEVRISHCYFSQIHDF